MSHFRIQESGDGSAAVLGQGGMGVVYLALQDKPAREVALKVVRPGYATERMLRRFELEAEVLGRLLHPGIAQIYEAGVWANPERQRRAAGAPDLPAGFDQPPIPFFAMELVKGVPLTRFAEEKKLGTRQRLELVAKVCDAVQHAHQKGVIHRDLKPGNILVTEEGQPKILDFGVARATDWDIQQTTMETDVGAIIGTIPYMSPEQVGGDPAELDTRSDVYALGVIAYELLVGRLPHDLHRKMLHEAARIIREEEPTRLSSIDRTLRGDVETIVAKALEKEKGRRYGAASALAADIRRYLGDEPIAARPASTWYQLAKFSRRNKGLVAGVTAAFAILVVGLAVTLAQRRIAITARIAEAAAREDEAVQRKTAEAQRDAAEAARRESDLIAEFMSDALEGAAPRVALGRDKTMLKEMMDAAAARIEKGDLKNAPGAELRLRGTIGNTYRELGEFDAAMNMIGPAVTLAETLHPGDHRERATSLNNMGLLCRSQGRAADAEPLFARALEMYQRLAPRDDPDVASCVSNLAGAHADLGLLAAAESLHAQALEMRQRLFHGDHANVADSLNNLAGVRESLGRSAEAETLYQQALEMRQRLFSGDHPDVATTMNNLAVIRWSQRRGDEAERLFEQALAMRRRLLPGDHPDMAQSLNNLAQVRDLLRRPSEAEALFEEALAMLRRLFPGDHPDVASTLNNLANVRRALGRPADAEPLLIEALEIKRRLFPGDHPSVANSINNLAGVRHALGRPAEAELLLAEALEMRRRVLPPGHPDTRTTMSNLAQVRDRLNRPADSEPLWRELLAMNEEASGAEDWRLAHTRSCLGGSLAAQSKFAEAEAFLVEGFEGLAASPHTPRSPRDLLRDGCQRVGNLYMEWDKVEPGKGYDAKAAEWKTRLDAIAAPTGKH